MFYACVYLLNWHSPPPSPPTKQDLGHRNKFFLNFSAEHVVSKTVTITFKSTFQFLPMIFILITFMWLSFVHVCCQVKFVTYNTNLDLYCIKKQTPRSPPWGCYFSFITLALFLSEWDKDEIFMFTTCLDISPLKAISTVLLFKKTLSRLLFFTSSLIMFLYAVTPVSNVICLITFQIICMPIVKNMPNWLSILLILLSNDVQLNPGPPYNNNFLNFMSWNLNSLTKNNFERVHLLEAHNSLHEYDLISICETNLKDSLIPQVPELNGYTFLSANHPGNTTHGGVGIFYKSSLPVTPRRDLSFSESIVLELNFGRKKIFFTVLYRSPAFKHNSLEFEAFLLNFKTLYTKIEAENPFATFFTGDFNGHSQSWWPDGDTNKEGSVMENLFTSLNLTQIISEPTNFEPGKRPSCIDLVITDQPNLILDSGTRASLDSLCHHQIIHGKINIRIPPPPPSTRKIWHYHRANNDAIKESMTNFPWLQHLNLNLDVNWQVRTFNEIILNIMSNYIPSEIKKIVLRDPPWINKQLKSLLNRKNRLFKNYKKHGYQAHDKTRLDAFRKECQGAVAEAKADYLNNLGKKLNNPTTSQKSYWKIINRVMNKSRAPKIPPILFNNVFILNCKEKAKIFNDFFSDQCKLIINSSRLPQFRFLTGKRIDHITIRNYDILSIIRNLNPNKATGSDEISVQMLLLCDNSVVPPLKIIFENMLRTSTYPDLWKLANVTPVFKKNNKQLIKNYRPISLLPICGKIFEKIVFNNLYHYFNVNNLITKNQSGFRPADSTTNQLLYLVNEIQEAFENPKCLEVRAVFLDISKAFDKVWHDGLIFKLKQNGVCGGLLSLLMSYLYNRKQRVVLNGSFSNYSQIESGVPQGSVLGPLLFLIYINDLEQNIKSNIKFFADDTMLFSIVKEPTTSSTELNHDLDIIGHWAKQWKMEFNPDPTKQATEVLFSYKKSSPNHPQLVFNGSVVAKVKEQKHLGLTLDPLLSFEKHLNEKISKAKKIIGMIKHLSKYLPIKTLDQMYKTLVRPHLDYCDTIYHDPPKVNFPPLGPSLTVQMEKVERIQYQAALAITGTWQGSNRNKLYEELGWESLSDRRTCRRILQIHKIENNKTPKYLKEKLPLHLLKPNVNVFTFYKAHTRTNRYMKSFFPDSISLWNIFINHFNTMPSFDKFKTYITSFFRPKTKSTFGIHDPLGIHYLYQLRVGLSPLRSHKKNHNFMDSPSDKCHCNGGIEDTNHFLFECPFYGTQRATLAAKVIQILLKHNLNHLCNQASLYLYGHELISVTDNKAILYSTIKYIKDTQRFLA